MAFYGIGPIRAPWVICSLPKFAWGRFSKSKRSLHAGNLMGEEMQEEVSKVVPWSH